MAASTDLVAVAVEAVSAIWIARLRTDRVAIFQASGSRAFRAVALIAAAVEADSVVIASAAADLAVIDLVVVAAALADSAAVAAADSEAGDENKCLEPTSNFFVELIKQRTHTNQNI